MKKQSTRSPAASPSVTGGYREAQVTQVVDATWRVVAGGSRDASVNFTKCKAGLTRVFAELSRVTPIPDDNWYSSVFQNFDTDNDGYISYTSFFDIIQQYHDYHAQRLVRKRLQQKDSKCDGKDGKHSGKQQTPQKPKSGTSLEDSKEKSSEASRSDPMKSPGPKLHLASHIVVPMHYGTCEVFKDFEFQKTLGRGQFGRVLQVVEKKTGYQRACKTISVLRPELPQYRDLINQEIELMKSLNHPNMLKLHKVYFDGMTIYLIMELCKGRPLFDRIVELENKRASLTEEKVAEWLDQILSATAYCHSHPQKIVHRDIKPENILFLSDSATSLLKVVDFGLSSTMDRIRHTQYEVYEEKGGASKIFARILPKVGGKSLVQYSVKRLKMESCGTPHYMAPEMIKGQYDEKCDLFSIGVILYQLLCGSHPFYSPGIDTEETAKQRILKEHPPTVGPNWAHVSSEGRELVRWMLEKNPVKRCTAAQARSHQWFKKMKKHTSEAFKSQLTGSVFQGLQNWQNENRLRQAVLGLLAKDLSEAEIYSLRKKFMAVDKEGKGTISIEDLRSSMHDFGFQADDVEDQLQHIMESFNADGTNRIGYNEFISALLSRHMAFEEDRLRDIFDKFDTQRKGRITVDDLRVALKGTRYSALSDSELDLIFGSVDLNKDGFVDFVEFMDLMTAAA